MSKKNFAIYLEFNYSKLNLAAFNKLNNQLEYYKEQSYKSYINSDQELNFDELQKLVEINIIEMEKSIDEFVKDIYLIIETPQTMSIQLSVIKNNEKKNILESLQFADLIKTNVQFKNNKIIDLRISDRVIATNE